MKFSPHTMNTIFVAILFLIVGNPVVYNLVDKILGRPILKTRVIQNGVPTRTGLVLHSVVFALAYYLFVKLT